MSIISICKVFMGYKIPNYMGIKLITMKLFNYENNYNISNKSDIQISIQNFKQNSQSIKRL